MNSGDEGKIFVGGLHWNTTNEGLKAYFEQFGQVLDCNIMRDPTGRSRCFGFVSFADPMVVDVILQKTHILDKKQIDPKRAIPKDQQQQPTSLPPGPSKVAAAFGSSRDDHKVFVGGIHIEADENDLKEFFSRYDQVLQTVLMRDRDTGRSRGFGFVTLASLEGAQRACADTEANIRGRRVEIKMAVPKGRAGVSSKHSDGVATSPLSSNADPYAAWADYFKQNPEYYEAMMKAYSNPAAMAAYYSQYYGQSGASNSDALGYYLKPETAGTDNGAFPFAGQLNVDDRPLETDMRRIAPVEERKDVYNYAEDLSRSQGRERRKSFRSRSRSASPRRGRSRSRSHSRSPPRHHHVRDRNADPYRIRREYPNNFREDDRDRRSYDRRERDRWDPNERGVDVEACRPCQSRIAVDGVSHEYAQPEEGLTALSQRSYHPYSRSLDNTKHDRDNQ